VEKRIWPFEPLRAVWLAAALLIWCEACIVQRGLGVFRLHRRYPLLSGFRRDERTTRAGADSSEPLGVGDTVPQSPARLSAGGVGQPNHRYVLPPLAMSSIPNALRAHEHLPDVCDHPPSSPRLCGPEKRLQGFVPRSLSACRLPMKDLDDRERISIGAAASNQHSSNKCDGIVLVEG